MPVRTVDDPIEDSSWSDLVNSHPAASVFHSPGWLRALRQTYGYEPFVATTSAGSTLENGIVACRVKGWTSRRVVSLPFSDHCEPLVNGNAELSELLLSLVKQLSATGGSVELRPRGVAGRSFETVAPGCELAAGPEYCLHRVDLTAEPKEIFDRFHPSSTKRAIRRAEREGLTHEAGTSDRLLTEFHQLFRTTRRRHGLPPPPQAWFQNILSCLGDRVAIHVARKDGRPIAGLLTLAFRNTIVYKYGGSDAAYHTLGAMPFLFWQVIQDARARGFSELDLGRSDIDQPGLIAFKDHLGATRSTLTYYRYPKAQHDLVRSRWMQRIARQVFARMPDAALELAGKSLYKHLG
jgi:lipid II:glycine glycyltransferase (peptidoglycan interpeptide bridge formation enzyme)